MSNLEYFQGRWHDRNELLPKLEAMESRGLSAEGYAVLERLRPQVQAPPRMSEREAGAWWDNAVRAMAPRADVTESVAAASGATDPADDEAFVEWLTARDAGKFIRGHSDALYHVFKAERRMGDDKAGTLEARMVAESTMLIAGDGRFIAGAADDTPHFEMTAYTGGTLDLANFRYPVVVDLATLNARQAMPALREGDSKRIVGHTTAVNVSPRQITARGIVSGGGKDAREVVESGKDGFPWRVQLGLAAGRTDFIPEGRSVAVNGTTFDGPVIVARDGDLRSVSFTPMGNDDTAAAITAAAGVTE